MPVPNILPNDPLSNGPAWECVCTNPNALELSPPRGGYTAHFTPTFQPTDLKSSGKNVDGLEKPPGGSPILTDLPFPSPLMPGPLSLSVQIPACVIRYVIVWP